MTSFTDLVDDPAEGTTLNNIAWEIYELYEAGRVDKKSKEMIAAKYMAEKAVKLDPDSGAINDTIAHFVYLIDGDIDKAIEYQKKAIANAEGGRTEDLQPFLDFLLKEKKTGKKKSLQKNPKKEKDDDADF
jgi:tetratricopeptide (TPR) repeat protein